MDVNVGRDTLLAFAAVAWADGKLEPAEAAGIKSAIAQLGITGEDEQAVLAALEQPIDLNEVETVRMNRLTRLFTYAVAYWVTGLTGNIAEQEKQALSTLGDRLGLSSVAREKALSAISAIAQLSPDERPEMYDLLKLKSRLSAGLSQVGYE